MAYSPAPMITTRNGWLMVANESEVCTVLLLFLYLVPIFEDCSFSSWEGRYEQEVDMLDENYTGQMVTGRMSRKKVEWFSAAETLWS